MQDLVLFFSILMLIFLIAPLAAEKLKVPELVLLLIAGIFLGKHGFNLIPESGEGAIELFGKIGVLYIMFISGLETDANDFKRMAKKSAVFGTLSFIIPQIIGTFISRYVLNYDWSASILLASMFASHTLIAYPIISRLGISRNESVVVTVGGTIPTNTFSLLVLAIIADISRNGGNLRGDFWIYIALGMVIMTVLIWFVLPIIAGWFFKNIPEKGGAQFLFVLGVVCLCAYGSQYARMEPIIGAFLAGVAFNRLIPAQSTLMNRLLFIGNTFFIPFFLISVGILINSRLLFSSWQGLFVAFVMSVVVVVTKYYASYLTCKIFKYNVNECKVMFGLSVAQAAATLAAVIVGYDLKIFDDGNKVLNGTIVMIMVSCAIGCYYVDRFGRKISSVDTQKTPENREQRIMVAISNPERAKGLVQLSFLLRNFKIPGEIFPITIIKESGDDKVKTVINDSEKLLNKCMEYASSQELSITPRIRLASNIADGLVRASKESRCDLMIFGWNSQHTLQSKIFGSLTDRLISDCHARLMLCRFSNPLNLTRNVYLPLPEVGYRRPDLMMLIQDAKQLTKQIGAILHVIIPEEFPRDWQDTILKSAPQCTINLYEIKSWGKYEQEFYNLLRVEDFLIMPLDRRESVLWRPRFDRMAELIAEKQPKLNLILAYPQIPQEIDDVLKLYNSGKTYEKRSKIYGVNLASNDLNTSIDELVHKMKLDTPYSYKNIHDGLVDSANYHPFELSDNCVLLHTRSSYAKECMLLIGLACQSFALEKLNGEYNTIIALVSPADDANDRHLQELASLARKFIDHDVADEVKNAKSVEEIVGIIRRNY